MPEGADRQYALKFTFKRGERTEDRGQRKEGRGEREKGRGEREDGRGERKEERGKRDGDCCGHVTSLGSSFDFFLGPLFALDASSLTAAAAAGAGAGAGTGADDTAAGRAGAASAHVALV